MFDNLQYDICIAKDVDLLLRKSLFKVNHAMDEFECLIFESFQYNFPIIYLEKTYDKQVFTRLALSLFIPIY